jgi:hypothetical protein
MAAIDKVKKSDRLALVYQYAQDISKGTKTIGSFEGKSIDVAECKRHFSDFYGEDTKEHELAHAILNILLIMERSIVRSGDDPNKKVSQWAKIEPLRSQIIEKIRELTSVGA